GPNATFGSPPLAIELTLIQTISSPSGTSGPLPATVRVGMGRPAESVPASRPGVSQASPMPSLSVSFWSGLEISGQLSPRFGKPSPSWSDGWFAGGPAVASVGVGSQQSGIPSGYEVPLNWSLSPCPPSRASQTVSVLKAHGSKASSIP